MPLSEPAHSPRRRALAAIHDAFDGRRDCDMTCVNMRRADKALRTLEERGFVLLAPTAASPPPAVGVQATGAEEQTDAAH